MMRDGHLDVVQVLPIYLLLACLNLLMLAKPITFP